MWRYLKAAFWARPQIPGLGRVPIIALSAAAMGILGFIQPAIWVLGVGLVVGGCFLLATNQRFQTLVDAGIADGRRRRDESSAEEAVRSLAPEARARLRAVGDKCRRIVSMYEDARVDSYIVQSNRDALAQLYDLAAKLLAAEQAMQAIDAASAERTVRREIDAIDRELAGGRASPAMRQSRKATRELLERRLEAVRRRQESLDEIASDLKRIETQVDLALDDAMMRGKPAAISANIGLVSRMLDGEILGSLGADPLTPETSNPALDDQLSLHQGELARPAADLPPTRPASTTARKRGADRAPWARQSDGAPWARDAEGGGKN